MSNVYIQEPPTNGKVLLKTSVGDIDLELWAKEAPKACRNFVQLCLEGYYDGTIFHRIVKGFIAQGGDPTGTGTGGESIYGQPFKDEFHTRLRFNRRGLVAMANAGKDDNGSQFFFTLAATPELQNKHTIFGKVTGETVFNMIKLEDALVDHDDRPQYPQKIISTEVLLNPFPDIVPRTLPKKEEKREKKKKDKPVGVKNFKLLSFGAEAEEDEEEVAGVNERFSGRGKSTHDILNDPNLSAVPAVAIDKEHPDSDDALSGDKSHSDSDESASEDDKEQVERIKKKLKKSDVVEEDTNEDEEFSFDRERKEERKRKAESIRKEIDDLKRSYQEDKKRKRVETSKVGSKGPTTDESSVADSAMIQSFKEEEKKCRMKSTFPRKGSSREDFTLNLLDKFRKKLHAAKERAETEETTQEPGGVPTAGAADNDEDDDSDGWLTHKLQFSDATPVLAKDASTKDDDWYEIHDPRSKLSQQRREISKNIMKSRERR